MTTDDFEPVLRSQLRARAAELDLSLRPAPPLWVLLGPPARKTGRLGTAALRFGLGTVAALAIAIAVICGALLFQALPQVQPMATVTPSPMPSLVSPSPSLVSPPSSRASPDPSLASPSASLALLS